MARKTAKRRQTKKKVVKRKTMKTKVKRVIRKRKGGAEEEDVVMVDIPQVAVNEMVRDIQRFEAEDSPAMEFIQLAADAADYVLTNHSDDNTRDQIRDALKEKLNSLDNQDQQEIRDLIDMDLDQVDFKVDAQAERVKQKAYEVIAGH